jgi:phospholipid/cholesterol/gamma-HCH transport system substrate-binding protein
MQKQAPTVGRILVMVGFALSCFGLLVFLWLSFGGPIPLKPKGYRFEASFPEATQLAIEADVRVAGVEVGKVRAKRLDETGNRTIATMEIDRRYAPVHRDARAALRQKTLLGETYVELRIGSRDAPTLPEGGRLPNRALADTVELDEILNSLDPYTRRAFRTWQQSLAVAGRERGTDLNDALGNLPGFVGEGADLFEVLDTQRKALGALVKNTGVVFRALTEREDQLRALIENSDTTFTAIQRQREAFAETWRIFPTFLDESKSTFARLDRFSRDTQPLVRDLRPALDDLGPALEDVGDLSPDLRRFFVNLDPLITISERSLPATRQIFDGLRPLLARLGPWLGQVNPILDWVGQHQHTLTDVFANLGVATAARTKSGDPRSPGHYLRQFGPTGVETASMHPNRLSSNRGNAYLNPLGIIGPEIAKNVILPAWDCKNAGGEKDNQSGSPQPTPACHEQDPYTWEGRAQKFPHVESRGYNGRG